MEESNKKNYTIIGGVIILVLAAASYGLFKYTKTNDSRNSSIIENNTTPPAPISATIPPATPVVAPTTYLYKNGIYPAIGNYETPGGGEQIVVTVTLKNDVVTDVTVEPKATRPTAVKYQSIFVNNFKSMVVGKNINDLQLDKVSGSSLTPQGFNDALDKIKASAKV